MKSNPEKINTKERVMNWERFREDLSLFSKTESLSGNEGQIRTVIENKLQELDIETSTDEKGNLWVRSAGEQGRFLLCVHMDKIGKGSPVRSEGDKLVGRLDDALGINMILNLFKEGYKPSALFTVEEESQQEVVDSDGSIRLVNRKLPKNIYNAGARYAADKMIDGDTEKPKVVIVIDTTKLGRVGNGPLIYTSGSPTEKGAFRFPSGTVKDMVKILREKNIEAHFIDGRANDAIEFSFVKDLGVLAIEIPINNYHSLQEETAISDIEMANRILKAILENPDKFQSWLISLNQRLYFLKLPPHYQSDEYP